MQKFIANLSDKERKVFYIALLFVFFALTDRLLIGPAMKKVSELEMKISQNQTTIKQDMKILARKDVILEQSKAFNKYYTETVKPSNDVNGEFLSQVTRIAGETNVNLIKSNPTEVKTQEKSIEYYANIDCVAKLEDMVNFMHAINSTDELFKIVRLNLSPKRGTLDEVSASMTIVKLLINPTMKNDVETP